MTLAEVEALLRQEVNLDAALHMMVDMVARDLGADRGTLFLLDGSTGELFSRAAHLPELPQIRLAPGQGLAGEVARTGRTINAPSARSRRQFDRRIDRLTGYVTRSVLAVPLRHPEGTVFGVLQVLNHSSGSFTAEHAAALEAHARRLASALEGTSLLEELRRAREGHRVGYFFNKVIGDSPAIRSVYQVVQRAAPRDVTVLIRGESGTGKELFARAIHANSLRHKGPFIKVDCASLPGGLIENELFGHERGAFTGADSRQTGKFEAAHTGTVFIDELGELPLALQGKILRVLQDREFQRVGGSATVPVDVRIVAATHRDLAALVRSGQFREDLYYRIRVVEVRLPPLRERGPDDIERLARHFVAESARKHGLEREPALSPLALARLRDHGWPGNVRELEHAIESAVVLCDGVIQPHHLAFLDDHVVPAPDRPRTARLTLAEAERRHIERTLAEADGNHTRAAAWLGIGRNTLARKLRSMKKSK